MQAPGLTEGFYHGTSSPLEVGDFVLPPSVTGNLRESNRKKSLRWVFLTTNLELAWRYARSAAKKLGGSPRVLVVKPEGTTLPRRNNPAQVEARRAVVCQVLREEPVQIRCAK
jgi:hypothetical protein